ncbi:hypothetical protein GPECTOR_10g1035 [Gonium pectorale]|uniref:SCP domain-containing protein n=1 Tax=Gonium pectorale TaxID=33097 RepID=A0A150GQF8_GONPE|nr:hypothetical protein GPECTOR_10g1035 [Gonium pectorale]|eukprot:KXZ52013.1 hypothetical protein GPECTOR_10g1035 [Gonium pectorale]
MPSAMGRLRAATLAVLTLVCALASETTVKADEGGKCSDAQETYDTANGYRSLHGAPPMAWSISLAASSQAYAETLAAQGCPLIHAKPLAFGENLMQASMYVISSPKPNNLRCADAVNGWYSQVMFYNFTTPTPYWTNKGRGVFHFSQVVWRSSTAFGCGVAGQEMPVASIDVWPPQNKTGSH